MDVRHLIDLLLLARVCVRGFKAGLDLDLVATKHCLAGSDKAASGIFALKTCCREVQFQAVIRGNYPEACIVCWPTGTLRYLLLLLRVPSPALPALHSCLAEYELSGKRVRIK
jgi:hypothetical protein